MRTSTILLFILLLFSSTSSGQPNKGVDSLNRQLNNLKRSNLEAKQALKDLSKRLDSIKQQLLVHFRVYDHSSIEISSFRSQLALRLNRNFTYSANFFEGETVEKGNGNFQRVFYFNGHRSAAAQNEALSGSQAEQLKVIRQNLSVVRDIVLGDQLDSIKYSDEFVVYPNQLIINYYDNVSGGEPIITADTNIKSLKVRINGLLQEVGWD